MDLNKLKISDEKRAPKSSKIPLIALCLLCLAVGFAGGKFIKIGGPKPVKVKTSVITGSGGDTQGSYQFTAGGWIEAASPRYPVAVSSRVSERVEEITVKQGQTVEPGQLLARMYDKDIRTRYELAKASKESMQK